MSHFLVLALVAFTSIAQARVLGVSIADAPGGLAAFYVASIEACPATYQSLHWKITKIAEGTALVEITPSLSVEACPGRASESRFVMPLAGDLTAAGLDSRTARLYFRL